MKLSNRSLRFGATAIAFLVSTKHPADAFFCTFLPFLCPNDSATINTCDFIEDNCAPSPGPMGPQGIPGMSVVGDIGLEGDIGPRGPQGQNFEIGSAQSIFQGKIQGPRGPQGPSGVAGAQGISGMQGLHGDIGISGLDGAVGVQGLMGPDGPEGPPGPPGVVECEVDGKNEPCDLSSLDRTGPEGPRGSTGPSGPPGTNGKNGKRGETGNSGVDGTDGTNGIDGETGAVGVQGTFGAKGEPGDNGLDIVGDKGTRGGEGPQGDPGIVLGSNLEIEIVRQTRRELKSNGKFDALRDLVDNTNDGSTSSAGSDVPSSISIVQPSIGVHYISFILPYCAMVCDNHCKAKEISCDLETEIGCEGCETFDNIRKENLAIAQCRVSSEAEATYWINEIHYDNESTDKNEGIEIMSNQNFPDALKIELYNGSPFGGIYETVTTTIGDGTALENGFYSMHLTIVGIQNGGMDAVCLSTEADNSVIQFLSYEGEITASSGLGSCADLTSTDIGVEQSASTPEGTSLQLSGCGSSYGDMEWQDEATSTFNDVNTGQTLVADAALCCTEERRQLGKRAPSLFDRYTRNSQRRRKVSLPFKNNQKNDRRKLQQEFNYDEEPLVLPGHFGETIMWAGSVDNIPFGWALADGSSFDPEIFKEAATVFKFASLPNMNGKVPLQVGGNSDVGATGGNAEVAISIDQLPVHTHDVTMTAFQADVVASIEK